VYYKSKLFFYLTLFGISYFFVPHIIIGQNNRPRIDSLNRELADAVGLARFNIVFDLFRLSLSSNMEDASRFAQEAVTVSIALNDTLSIIKSYNALGYVRSEMGYPQNAVPFLEKGLALARIKAHRDQVKFILNNMGMAYKRTANYSKSLQYYLESLKIREEDQDTEHISVALNNIGVLYQDMGDYENALTYYKRNYELKLQAKEFNEFELCLINLADVSNALGKYGDSKKYLMEVFERCSVNAACSQRLLALAHNAMGYSHLNTSDYTHAEQEFILSGNIFSELKLPDQTSTLHSLALVRYKMGDYEGALEKLGTAQTLAEEIEIPKFLLNNYQLYADIYHKQKDFKKAAEYQRKFIALNEEIYNADLIKNIARVQSEYQEEANLRTIAEKDQEIVSREERLAFQQKQVFFLVIIIVLVGVIAIVMFINQKRAAKSKLALELANKTIEEKNRDLVLSNAKLDQRVNERTMELHSSNESLKKVNEELDNFIYKTSHDIRGPLSSLKGLTNLVLRESKDENVNAYLSKLDLTADKLNRILTRLQIINQINHTILVPELIDFNLLIEEILQTERKLGMPVNLKINTNVGENIVLFSDKTILKIVLENLIDNAIKFYNPSERANPFVNITIQDDSGVTVKVLDNGIGIKNVAPDKIFKMFMRASERSESGGIGLYLAKISTEKLGGSIDLRITPEECTEFVVSLPVDLRAEMKKRDEQEVKVQVERMLIAKQQSDQSKQIAGQPA
jgi:signal transduction histidine kinase